MARPQGKKYAVGPPNVAFLERSIRAKAYFFVDGSLYRIIKSDRANDLVRAWSFERNVVVDFVWADVKRNGQQAFTTREVAKLLNRTPRNILQHVKDEAINEPVRLKKNEGANIEGGIFYQYKWSEDDVLALHEHYLTVGSGRPRKDGMLRAGPRLPTRMELIAMMKQNKMIYIQNSNGEFVPVFEAPEY